jgi:hypothetical protein
MNMRDLMSNKHNSRPATNIDITPDILRTQSLDMPFRCSYADPGENSTVAY